jgi:hypothetical protein
MLAQRQLRRVIAVTDALAPTSPIDRALHGGLHRRRRCPDHLDAHDLSGFLQSGGDLFRNEHRNRRCDRVVLDLAK